MIVLLLACQEEPAGPQVPAPELRVDSGQSHDDRFELLQSGPIHCSDPGRRIGRFYDRVALPVKDPPWRWVYGGGVAVADLDDDGWHDLLFTGVAGLVVHYGGGVGRVRLDVDTSFASSVVPADVDGDGDLDLFVTRYGERDLLLLQQDGAFVDGTRDAGLWMDPDLGTGASFGDIDGDGDLDLAIGNYGEAPEGVAWEDFPPGGPNRLFLNNGDGTFVDVSDRMDMERRLKHSFGMAFVDLDVDGDLELVVVNDFAHGNDVFWNDGKGHLEPDDGTAGLAVKSAAMGMAFGDINGDRKPDMVVTAWPLLFVLESNSGLWFDTAETGNLSREDISFRVGWGADLGDLDLDGDLDLIVSFGTVEIDYRSPENQADGVWTFDSLTGDWVDVGAATLLGDHDVGRGVITADVNNDGYLDVVRANLKGPARVDLSRCGTAGWLRVELRDETTPNTRGIGARVLVKAGPLVQERDIWAGGRSYLSAAPAEAHFGLAGLDRVDLEVIWPDGERTSMEGVRTRQRVRITRR